MTASSYYRGHEIYYDEEIDKWRYCDNDRITEECYLNRACGYCGLEDTRDGHDGCLGTLDGVRNACCGHGMIEEAYIQYPSGSCVRGKQAIYEMLKIRGVKG